MFRPTEQLACNHSLLKCTKIQIFLPGEALSSENIILLTKRKKWKFVDALTTMMIQSIQDALLCYRKEKEKKKSDNSITC